MYTYPELRIDRKENISYLSAEKLLNSKYYLDKVFIVGDRQSGKTSFAKKLFLDILSPNVLAASQNHIWGVNDTLRDKIWNLLVFNNSFARFIYADMKNIIRPIKPLLAWIRYFYYLTKHSALWLKGLLENIKTFKK